MAEPLTAYDGGIGLFHEDGRCGHWLAIHEDVSTFHLLRLESALYSRMEALVKMQSEASQ